MTEDRRDAGLTTWWILAVLLVVLGLVAVSLQWRGLPTWPGSLFARPPNVILISIDSLRADHLSAYGYPRRTSPEIDSLAADGILFEQAFSTTSWTLPAHVSLLTSLYPEIHGVNVNRKRLGDRVRLLPELLQAQGYRTLGVVSAPLLESKFGYDRGFDLYDDQTVSFRTHEESHLGVTSPRLHERILEVLDTRAREPFFLFLHYWDVHYDYQPPPPFNTRFRPDADGNLTAADLTRRHGATLGDDPAILEDFIALYDGEIGYVDEVIGKLFDRLRDQGLYRDSLIIVTSDHGEEFLEHGMLWHRWNLYDATLRIPLIVKLPRNRNAGTRVSRIAGIVDVMPTILDVAGAPIPPGLDGRSLLPLVASRDADDAHVYFAELLGLSSSVRRGRWKLIRTARSGDGKAPQSDSVELYDLEVDPGEGENLAEREPGRVAELDELRRSWLTQAATDGRRSDGVPFEYDADLEDALRSLGYVD